MTMTHFSFTLNQTEAELLLDAIQDKVAEALEVRADAIAEGNEGKQKWADGHGELLRGLKEKVKEGMTRNCQEGDAPMVSCSKCGEPYPESELDGLDGELWCILCDLNGD
ncbi:MAG: hypothetical protein ACYTFG_00095 [Planctomycetota bacterium]|jgi:formylmethanofuran dehydrogenase subunit E